VEWQLSVEKVKGYRSRSQDVEKPQNWRHVYLRADVHKRIRRRLQSANKERVQTTGWAKNRTNEIRYNIPQQNVSQYRQIWYTASSNICQHFCWKLHKCVLWASHSCNATQWRVHSSCIWYHVIIDFSQFESTISVYTQSVHPNHSFLLLFSLFSQESHAIARKPCDGAAVRFGLKFADIHHKCNSSYAPKAML